MVERLKGGPEPTAKGRPPAARWSLGSIRAAFPELADRTLGGVWRALRGLGLKLRSARVQQYSPDLDYDAKVARLGECLRAAGERPGRVVALFLDEMGYNRWPDPGRDWGAGPPADAPFADRRRSPGGLWRLVGTLDACTGRVLHADGYIVGRRQLIDFYARIERAYPGAGTIYVIQDNWSIHKHDDVLSALTSRPRIEPVWLPTYAPWLNPIEKLWRWLRQEVLRMHRLADDWPGLRSRVNGFLDRFARGSRRLREYVGEYVGLRGEGKLPRMLHGL